MPEKQLFPAVSSVFAMGRSGGKLAIRRSSSQMAAEGYEAPMGKPFLFRSHFSMLIRERDHMQGKFRRAEKPWRSQPPFTADASLFKLVFRLRLITFD